MAELTQQQKDILFLKMTRQNMNTVDIIDYEDGRAGDPVYISKVGYLAKVYLEFKGTLTCTHATKTSFTKAADAPYNILRNIRMKLNGGVTIWDTSGFGTYLRNLLDVRNNVIDDIVSGRDVFQFEDDVSDTGEENDIQFTVELPIMINERDPIGLLMLQSDKAKAQLDVTFDRPEVLMTDDDVTCSLTGTITIHTETFDIPGNTDARPDPRVVHIVEQDQIALTGTGRNKYVFRPGKIYQRAIFRVLIDGAAAADSAVENMSLVYNQNKIPYDVSASLIRYLNRKRYGRDLPAGVYVWDFGYQGMPILGNGRDYVDASSITEFWNIITIASGTSFGTSNNIVECIAESLEPLKVG